MSRRLPQSIEIAQGVGFHPAVFRDVGTEPQRKLG